MDDGLISVLFGLAIITSTIGFPLPQMIRMLRTGEMAGVSFTAVLNCAISDTAWAILAIQLNDPWLIAGCALAVPGSLVTAYYMWHKSGGSLSWRVPAIWSTILVAAGVADFLLRIPIFDTVVSVSLLWLVLPALWLAWRSTDVSGIACNSWYALAAQGALWLGYGIIANQVVSAVFGTVGIVGAVLILIRVQVLPRLRARPVDGILPRILPAVRLAE